MKPHPDPAELNDVDHRICQSPATLPSPLDFGKGMRTRSGRSKSSSGSQDYHEGRLKDEKLANYRWNAVWTHLAAVAIGFFVCQLLTRDNPPLLTGMRGSSDCRIDLGAYKGPIYRSDKMTIGRAQCLVSSKFMKLQLHQVRMKDNVIPDWLFIDYHDRINVLVEAPGKPNHFMIFEQTKYSLEDRVSAAIVGGFIEPGEDPEQAARREVQEEMKVDCVDFHFLGRYRTDVNRGSGWTNTYVAVNCRRVEQQSAPLEASDEIGAPDTERQDIRTVGLDELRDTVREAKFLEIQWTATVSLAMLHQTLQ